MRCHLFSWDGYYQLFHSSTLSSQRWRLNSQVGGCTAHCPPFSPRSIGFSVPPAAHFTQSVSSELSFLQYSRTKKGLCDASRCCSLSLSLCLSGLCGVSVKTWAWMNTQVHSWHWNQREKGDKWEKQRERIAEKEEYYSGDGEREEWVNERARRRRGHKRWKERGMKLVKKRGRKRCKKRWVCSCYTERKRRKRKCSWWCFFYFFSSLLSPPSSSFSTAAASPSPPSVHLALGMHAKFTNINKCARGDKYTVEKHREGREAKKRELKSSWFI